MQDITGRKWRNPGPLHIDFLSSIEEWHETKSSLETTDCIQDLIEFETVFMESIISSVEVIQTVTNFFWLAVIFCTYSLKDWFTINFRMVLMNVNKLAECIFE